MPLCYVVLCFLFFNDPATPEIYTLSLHDALPIWMAIPAERTVPSPRSHEGHEWLYVLSGRVRLVLGDDDLVLAPGEAAELDRKSTRLNSSHVNISYAVFCLKKKK